MTFRTYLVAALLLVGGTSEAGGLFRPLVRDAHYLMSSEPLAVMGAGTLASGAAFFLEDGDGHRGFLGAGLPDRLSSVLDAAFGWPLPVASAGTWAAGALSGDSNTELTGRMLTEGIVVTYGITFFLKLGTARTRPDGSDRMSFPSGHSSGTACAAVIMWDQYGPAAGVPAAALAALTAISRVQLGRHYPSDVLAGAAIGVAAGLAVVQGNAERAEEGNGLPQGMGLQWSSTAGFGVYF